MPKLLLPPLSSLSFTRCTTTSAAGDSDSDSGYTGEPSQSASAAAGDGGTAGGDETVLVMGAGNVGGWLGGRLVAAGVPVTLVGRTRVLDNLRSQGLRLTDHRGGRLRLKPKQLTLRSAVPKGLNPGLVLLCVRHDATADAVAELAERLPAGTPVVSLQLGVGHAALAQQLAPQLTVLPGLVPFQVAELRPGHLHRRTAGRLVLQDHPVLRRWLPVLRQAGLPTQLQADLRPLQWGQLLLGLNGAINALSGLPLQQQLQDRRLRLCTAALVDEALDLLQRAGIRPARLAGLPPGRLPQLWRLPTPLFQPLATRLLRLDAQPRPNMADDLALGRPTEVDALQGEVVRLAQQLGREAPLNARVANLVQQWPQRPVQLDGSTMCDMLRL